MQAAEATLQLDEAVAEVFAVMLNLPIEIGLVPHLRDGPLLARGGEGGGLFTASVFFSGTLEGICTLQLTDAAAADLTANLTGIPAIEIPADLCADTAGELCNMIAGSWKTRQKEARAACDLSCPTVAAGAAYVSDPTLTRLYRTPSHVFSVVLTCDLPLR